ncbi:ionic transporter y4hA [uncultured Aquabacterium sp.]|uniref:calcium:proton antiporter n=1 Tax=Aquabacterium sp. TaxID=1872578 RepID=UPI0025CC8063|nr:ionic transporter y4hA [uncultured Aquabacterium sp.]
MPLWTVLVPLVAAGLLGVSSMLGASVGMLALFGGALMLSVLAAVHHAEVIAHKVGEPLGTLVLALAVTVIEVALIVSIMMAGGAKSAAVPRDTVYAAIMIICTGVLGLCVLIGAVRHRVQTFRVAGANAGLSALMALATLSLVLPSFTTSTREGTYSPAQLVFAGVASLVLWLVFIFVQTVRHRDYFLPEEEASNEHVHAAPPGTWQALASLSLLLVALVAVVGLAKLLSPAIEQAVSEAGAPKAVIGVVIALLVLLPETVAAIRAAHANRLQTSLNLAIGSALASIGLTIPAVAVVSVWLDLPLQLGIVGKDLVLLLLTFAIAIVTLGHGRTTVMQGAVHLVIFAAFLFLTLVP